MFRCLESAIRLFFDGFAGFETVSQTVTCFVSVQSNARQVLPMIVDKTKELYAKRNAPCNNNYTKVEITCSIRKMLDRANKHYQTIKLDMERHCLPSFCNRKRKMSEIHKQKCDLNLNILQIENMIGTIDHHIKNTNVSSKIKEHFYYKLKRLLINYRNAEEIFLKKINNVKLFDNLDNEPCTEQPSEMQEMLLIKNANEAEQIKQSIFFLTTMLMDMKMVISSHTAKIDRIEEYFDETHENIRATNEELKKIPKRHNKIKNRVIYFLSLSVIILICFSTIKAAKHKQKR